MPCWTSDNTDNTFQSLLLHLSTLTHWNRLWHRSLTSLAWDNDNLRLLCPINITDTEDMAMAKVTDTGMGITGDTDTITGKGGMDTGTDIMTILKKILMTSLLLITITIIMDKEALECRTTDALRTIHTREAAAVVDSIPTNKEGDSITRMEEDSRMEDSTTNTREEDSIPISRVANKVDSTNLTGDNKEDSSSKEED